MNTLQTPDPAWSRPGEIRRGLASSLLSKQGQVVTALAAELLSLAAGERLARVQAYADRFDASVGTVMAALDQLQSGGAARLEARGRLGTFARELHYPLLWSIAFARPIVGALPLPYSKRFEGLATGLRLQFGHQPLDLALRFLRGSGARFQALASRECDWTLVSRFAAETAYAHGFEVEIVALLGPDTYMAGHVLLLRGGSGDGLRDGMRVGVDPLSADHLYVVRSVCRGTRVHFVDMEYSQGVKLLASGAIDATVWSREDIPAELVNATALPLDERVEPALGRLGEAAIVVARGDRAATHVLQATLDLDALRQVQREVVQLARVPAY